MRDFFVSFVQIVAVVVKYFRPGGAKAAIVESLLLKNQLLIINRSRRRTPNLTPFDRAFMGVCSLFMNPDRIRKSAVILKSTTLLKFHNVLKKKYIVCCFRRIKKVKLVPKELRKNSFAQSLR